MGVLVLMEATMRVEESAMVGIATLVAGNDIVPVTGNKTIIVVSNYRLYM